MPGRDAGPGGARGGRGRARRARSSRCAQPPPPTPEAVAEIEAVTQHDVIAFLSAWADNTDAARGRRVRALRDDLAPTCSTPRWRCSSSRPPTCCWSGPTRLVGRAARPRRWRTGRHAAGRAAPTASTPSPTSSAIGSPTSRSAWRAAATGCARARDGVGGVQDLRRGRHVLEHRPGGRAAGGRRRSACTRRRSPPRSCCATASPSGWRRSPVWPRCCEADRAGGAARAAHRGPRALGAVRQGPEGLVGDAAQEEPDHLASGSRAGPDRARPGRAGARGRPALARARHLPLARPSASPCPTPPIAHRLPAAPDHPTGHRACVVDADRMRANLESTGGLIYTSAVLLALVESGHVAARTRTPLVQAAAMETWATGVPVPRDACARHARRARAEDRRGARWTRRAGPSATSNGSTGSSSGSPRCPEWGLVMRGSRSGA